MIRGMKDSGVEWIGEIPEDWNIGKIKNSYDITLGKMLETTNIPNEDVSNYLCAANIKWNGVSTVPQKKMHFSAKEKVQYLLSDGDVLISEGGMAGTSCIYHNELSPCYIQNSVHRCTANRNNNTKYLYYWIHVVLHSGYINSICHKATIMHYTKEKVEQTPIPVLSSTKQQQIVHFLDRKCMAIDNAIEKTKKSIEKLDEYKKAVITKAVTKGIDPNAKMKDSGVEWIGEIPDGWKVTKTKYLFRILKRIAGCEGFDVISITQKGLKIKDITSNEGQVAENYSNYQFVFPGDFAMNHMDLLTGWVDLSALTGVTSPDYRVFHKINESVNDDYYKYVFQSLYFNKVYYGLAQGVAEVGRKRLQAPAFKELKLPCPPADEPAKIAAYIKNKCMAIDALIEKKQTAINKWEEYKKSLIYYAVTGKIDCRNEVIE